MSKFQREDHVAIQKAVAPIILSPDFRATDWESRAIEDVAIAAIRALATRPQLTASVDAEPVAWLYRGSKLPATGMAKTVRVPVLDSWTETPLYTEAQMQARAARIAALEAKLAEKDALLRECGEALEQIERKAFPNLSRAHVYLDTIRAMARATLAKVKDATDAD